MESKLTSNLPHNYIGTCKATLKKGDILYIDGSELKFEYEGSNCIVSFKYAQFNMNYIIKFIKPIKKKAVKKKK